MRERGGEEGRKGERDKGIEKEKREREREGGIVAMSVDFQSLPFPDLINGLRPLPCTTAGLQCT